MNKKLILKFGIAFCLVGLVLSLIFIGIEYARTHPKMKWCATLSECKLNCMENTNWTEKNLKFNNPYYDDSSRQHYCFDECGGNSC